MEYRILGSLEATRDEKALPLGGAKQRAVLAILLMNANRVVTTDSLVDSLWAGKAPGKPQTAIQGYVSQLRKAIDAEQAFEVIVTEAAGYRLPVGPDQLDLFRFEFLLQRGRAQLQAGTAADARASFGEALALFRGPPLVDFTYESWAQQEISRLQELRLVCIEERIDADLALGRHDELVGEIEALVADHPLQERLRGQLMLALYRSGRQSEALAAYQEARRVLVDEFGIEPTRALQELERQILLQDPALDLTPATPGVPQITEQRTLLFSDIEGSTRLVHRLGTSYAHVLVEHRRLVRDAIERAGGRVVDNAGDCFFATFHQPAEAAVAAADAQRALASYPWPDQLPVRVRIGIHTGEPIPVGDGFIGLDVHRTARICNAGHGGQVLLSKDAADLLDSASAPGIALRDLGEFTLKDLQQPERLYQLLASGLVEEFLPPRSDHASDRPAAERSILVVAHAGARMEPVVDIAAGLAGSVPGHGLIVAQLVGTAGRTPGELAELLAQATSDLEALRVTSRARGLDARVAAFTSETPGEDIVRLASEQDVDLVLLERRAEQIEPTALDAELDSVFAGAPSDAAVCVLREHDDTRGAVLVPFAGGVHDWAALELGAWVARANGVGLTLAGVAGDPATGKRDASRLLAAASLAVQRLVGVTAEPLLLPAGADGLLRSADEASAAVLGVPEDWRERGLGEVRSEVVRSSRVTTLLVRRGVRPGGLAPPESQTRYTWSLADVGT